MVGATAHLRLSILILSISITSAGHGANLRVTEPDEHPYRAKIVRARWIEIGDYQYFLIDSQGRSAVFAKDRGRDIQVLLRVPKDRPTDISTPELEGYAFWYTTWFDKSGRVLEGRVLKGTEDGAMMISGDVRIRMSLDENSDTDVPELTTIVWQRVLAEHDPSMAPPLLAPIWLKVEPTLADWQHDLQDANMRTHPEE